MFRPCRPAFCTFYIRCVPQYLCVRKTLLMKRITALFLILAPASLNAQTPTDDSLKVLEHVVVHAFESNTALISTPAAVSLVNKRDLNRYDNEHILHALNMRPGIRMEERSPGSYRLNIRGSSMRSPFGVSNVKVYYDGIPVTGPGGGTDLNMLGFYDVHSVEIVKGPAGSLYGAGTGGALLIESGGDTAAGYAADYTGGSSGLSHAAIRVKAGGKGLYSRLQYQRISSDGYREHTAMHRDVLSWSNSFRAGENTDLHAHFFFSDLYYQTPGALTRQEYNQNPRRARPAAGPFPSAADARASISDQAFFSGVSLKQKINRQWTNTTSLYGYYFRHNNPNFRNYTRRVEPHFGGRTNFRYEQKLGDNLIKVNLGAELQQAYITSRLYHNVGGSAGAMQTDDEVQYSRGFVFLQALLEARHGWIFSAGSSLNRAAVRFEKFSLPVSQSAEKLFRNETAPRFSMMKKAGRNLSVYASAGKGFSPPASSELLPTSGVFNSDLQAERGMNYELGTRGSLHQNRLFFDVSAYFYRLQNTLVQRQDAGGGIFYENAGSTNQRGLETYASYTFRSRPQQFFNYGFAYLSHTWTRFRYRDYKQLSDDYSGNTIPGSAPHTLAAGVDFGTRAGVYTHLTYFFSSRIFLNDENTEAADAYHLAGIKAGYKTTVFGKVGIDLYCGAQNLLDERYSLGNDINAAAGRHYNLAAGRSYYLGLSVSAAR